MDNPDDILNMPFVEEAKEYFKKFGALTFKGKDEN